MALKVLQLVSAKESPRLSDPKREDMRNLQRHHLIKPPSHSVATSALGPSAKLRLACRRAAHRAERTKFAQPELFAFDPDVWSGRASQEDFVELAVS
ncbi:hypothetical protein, partial [uncultured Bradyrhizobium sp.]|uniref:hypothetical protein n=1 Tax=uncultured Bradyrhizobium sp. TaxID=199684 RepID=UPI0026032167